MQQPKLDRHANILSDNNNNNNNYYYYYLNKSMCFSLVCVPSTTCKPSRHRNPIFTSLGIS